LRCDACDDDDDVVVVEDLEAATGTRVSCLETEGRIVEGMVVVVVVVVVVGSEEMARGEDGSWNLNPGGASSCVTFGVEGTVADVRDIDSFRKSKLRTMLSDLRYFSRNREWNRTIQ